MTIPQDTPAGALPCSERVVDLLNENARLLAEFERRDRQRAWWFTWWCRGWLAGYRAARVRRRQAP